MSDKGKSIILHPSWKAFFWSYFFGVLLIPLFIGIYLLWRTHQKKKKTYYKVTDHHIASFEEDLSQSMDLINIYHVTVQNQFLNTGTILLKSNVREMKLIGMEDPEQLQVIIEKAISAERTRLETEKHVQPRQPKFKAGEMDRLDYLTGLWQQGLISNEDFEKEKRGMEN